MSASVSLRGPLSSFAERDSSTLFRLPGVITLLADKNGALRSSVGAFALVARSDLLIADHAGACGDRSDVSINFDRTYFPAVFETDAATWEPAHVSDVDGKVLQAGLAVQHEQPVDGDRYERASGWGTSGWVDVAGYAECLLPAVCVRCDGSQ